MDDSGEGRWRVAEAIALDVPAPVITLAVQARLRSRIDNSYADRLLALMRQQFGGHAISSPGRQVTRLAHSYRILPDLSEVARVTTAHVEAAVNRAIASAGRFALVLAGGATPVPVYELIAARGRIAWRSGHVFWSDERCVPPDHPESNYGLAAAALFARAAPPREHVHRIPAELGAVEAAARYEDELTALFGVREPALMPQPAFDLVLLGMGDDGHTASLFPGDSALMSPRWAAPARAPAGVDPAERVTLTLAAIAAASEVCFIVTGAKKRDMVARVLSREPTDIPAARVKARHRVRWILDREAGARLLDEEDAG